MRIMLTLAICLTLRDRLTAQALPPVTAPVPAAVAPAKNLFSFFIPTPEQKARCRVHFCTSPAGQLVNSLLKPAAGITGGLLGPICPSPLEPNAADLAKPADSPQGAAARIKAEEAQVAAKVADLEYLAQRNCKRYPEAEAALINGLRAEKNECVRIAAAKGLARGCCCTAKVLKALTLSVNGSTADGFPAEDSPRVKLLAFVALERCVANCAPAEPAPEPPGKPAPESVIAAGYYESAFAKLKPADVVAEARAALAAGITVPPGALPRPRSLADAWGAPATVEAAQSVAPEPSTTRSRTLRDVLGRIWE